MNLMVTLLFAVFFQAQAVEVMPGITITKHHASLTTVFGEIKKQTNYLFLYNQELITLANEVDVNVKDAPLDKVLNLVFANQPLTYSIVDKTIVLHLKKQQVAPKVLKPAPPLRIGGTVVDEKGQPVQGVSVMVKGSKAGTQTGVDGSYSIQVPDASSILVFTFIGYKNQEVAVGNRTNITITLVESFGQLADVVVSGYTVQNRADFTGSSAHIGSKDIANRPIPSFDQALAGQAPGVKITSGGGSLNTPPVFRVRGTNSITLSSYPLIVIDGITTFTGDVGNSAENNPLSTINTEDIESIEVLKDASATAIYGSRAANGVVVITTKKGKPGKAKVNYSGWFGLNTKPKLPDMLGVTDYITIKNESLANIGSAPAYFPQTLADGSTVSTNWYDYVYQTGKSQNHNLSVSGASDATSYFVSLGYSDQEGFLVKNTFDRKVARANLDHKLTKHITIGTNLSYGNTLNNNLTSGVGNSFGLNNLVRESMVLPPNLSPFNPDGSYNINGSGIGYGANTVLTGYYNPLPQLEHDKFTSESNSFLGSVYGEWEFLKGLKAKINYSINNLNTVNRSFSNPYQAGGFSTNGSATNTQSRNYRTDATTTLNYITNIAKNHNLNILAGYQEIHTTSNSFGVTRTNLTDRYYESFEGSFTTIGGSSSAYGENGFRSYFSNLFYDYKKKYLLSASFRRDGYSGLANGLKFGNFGGGSIGWNVHEEGFFQSWSLAKNISSLKIRASYGQVGNVNIGNYPALSLYSSGVYGGVASLGIAQAGNTDLKWETSKKTDFGINLGLWQNKITIDADYFNNNIDGLILAAPQAPSKGIPNNSITANIGSMYNRGFEFNIQAHIIDKGRFKWTTGLNYSTLKNRVTALASGNADLWTSGLETSNITRVGYSVASIYVIPTKGVNPANGLRTYLNKEDKVVQYNPVGSAWTYLDGTTAPALDLYTDSRIMGPTLPTYYGGFNNTFSYNNFDLYVNVVYSGGNQIYNGTRATLLDNRFFNNQVDILRRWTTPGQVTDIPALHYNDQYASGSVLMNSANVEDGGYIKLGNVQLGYTIPSKSLKKIGISSIRVYGSASNIIIHTNYTGSDPEISANGDSNTASGRDKNSVPAGKTFTLGVNVGF
ncbi:TonB-dependent receptor [Mucilaginibacter sp.]|uniref:TonB-dependent receptor n=1 Tax=Mucilaginibacter sp. TaxID=1882438 RepID=UPI003562F52A